MSWDSIALEKLDLSTTPQKSRNRHSAKTNPEPRKIKAQGEPRPVCGTAVKQNMKMIYTELRSFGALSGALALVVLAGHASAALVTFNASTDNISKLVSGTGVNTGAAQIGNNTAESADGAAIWGSYGFSYAFSGVGTTITLTGTVVFQGTTVSGVGDQFRVGLYDLNGSATATGWLGYLGSGAGSGIAGQIRERSATGGYWSGTGATTLGSTYTSTPAGLNWTNGTQYNFTFSLTRTLAGVDVVFDMRDGSGNILADNISRSDTTVNAGLNSIDRVGFLIGSSIDADQVNFTNVKIVPEPGVAILGALGVFGLLRRRRS